LLDYSEDTLESYSCYNKSLWRWPMSTVTKKELVDRIAQSARTKQVLVRSVIQHFLGVCPSNLF